MTNLLLEVREEFQIPPYFSNENLQNYINECSARLKFLNPLAKETDPIFRMLLKNYVYYAYHHRIDEFEENYKKQIISWQLGACKE